MNNYFNNLGVENPLIQSLRQYVSPIPQNEHLNTTPDTNRSLSLGAITYEIENKNDIEYIEPDKSGRRQIYICDSENKIYIGRYNHVRKEMDYRAYIDEGEISLVQKNDTIADISKIAEALVLVTNKLDTICTDIQDLKNNKSEPVVYVNTEPTNSRKSNGQFKKKGES